MEKYLVLEILRDDRPKIHQKYTIEFHNMRTEGK